MGKGERGKGKGDVAYNGFAARDGTECSGAVILGVDGAGFLV